MTKADTEEFPIEILHGGAARNGRMLLENVPSVAGEEVRVVVEYAASQFECVADNYFDALVCIRRQLEPQGARVRCYGSAVNVYPSPMGLSMGHGRKAYSLTLGRRALKDDLVDIFARTPDDVKLGTVDEQESFYDEWLQSLR